MTGNEFAGRLRSSRLPTALTLVALAAAAGCSGGGEIVRRDVTGKVTHAGQPVAAGTITFVDNASGQAASSPLGVDGGYSVSVPDGDYVVYVTPPTVAAPADPNISGGETYADAPNIPQKYRSESTTDLKAAVSDSATTFDFELK